MKLRNIVLIVFFLSIVSTTKAQWEKLPIAGENITLHGEMAFNNDLSLGYFLQRDDDRPHLYQTHDSGKSWKRKRFFFTDSKTTFLDLKLRDSGKILMLHKSKICVLDTVTLLLDTLYDLEANLLQPTPIYLGNTEWVFVNDKVGFALRNNVFKTIDGGDTWQPVNGVFAQLHRSLHFIDEQHGYFIGLTAGENMKLYSTDDGGSTWDTSGMNLNFMGNVAVQFISPDTGFLGGNDNCIYKTTDRGITWNKLYCLNDGKEVNTIKSIQFITSQIGWIFIDGRSNVYKTVDGGKNFFMQELKNSTAKSYWTNELNIITPSLIYTGQSGFNYRSTNQGGSPMLSIKPVSGEKAERNVTLYPNPAKNSITFNVEGENSYNIRVFDIMGKEYASLIDISSNTTINIENLPTGIYFLQYINGSCSKSIKFIKE